MSRFPNLPPPKPGDAMQHRPRTTMVDPKSTVKAPVVAAPPRRDAQPAQVPLTHLSDKEVPASAEDNDALIEEFLKDRHTLPTIVLALSVVLGVGAVAVAGHRAGGMASATMYLLGFLAILVTSCAAASGAGWVVSKIFNEDFGSAGVLALRFSAVAAAQFPVLGGLVYILGFWPAMLINIPVMMGVTIFVAGIDFFRSIVFSVILGVINLMLASFAVRAFELIELPTLGGT